MTGETVGQSGEQQNQNTGANALESIPPFEEHINKAEQLKYGAEIAKEKQFAKEDLSFAVLENGKEYSHEFPGEKEVQECFREEGYTCIRLGEITNGIPSVSRTEEDFLVARHLAKKLNAEMLASKDDAEKTYKSGLLAILDFEYNSPLQDHDITANLRRRQDDKYRTEEGKTLDRELVRLIETEREAYTAFEDSVK